jgi:hypothetical protein
MLRTLPSLVVEALPQRERPARNEAIQETNPKFNSVSPCLTVFIDFP